MMFVGTSKNEKREGVTEPTTSGQERRSNLQICHLPALSIDRNDIIGNAFLTKSNAAFILA